MKLRPRHRLLLMLIILAGAALRLYRLGADSLWYDETVSTYLAGSRLPDLLRHTAGDIHPPGYYSSAARLARAHGLSHGPCRRPRHWAGVLGCILLAILRHPADRPGLRPGTTSGEPPGRTHRRAAGGAQPVQRLVQPGSADVHAGRGAGGRGGVRAGADRAGDRGQGQASGTGGQARRRAGGLFTLSRPRRGCIRYTISSSC